MKKTLGMSSGGGSEDGDQLLSFAIGKGVNFFINNDILMRIIESLALSTDKSEGFQITKWGK